MANDAGFRTVEFKAKTAVVCGAKGCNDTCPLWRVQRGLANGDLQPATCRTCDRKFQLPPGAPRAAKVPKGPKQPVQQNEQARAIKLRDEKMKKLERELAKRIQGKECEGKDVGNADEANDAEGGDDQQRKEQAVEKLQALKTKVKYLESLDEVGKELFPNHDQQLEAYKKELEEAHRKL